MKEHTEFCQRHGFTYEVGSGEPIPECVCDKDPHYKPEITVIRRVGGDGDTQDLWTRDYMDRSGERALLVRGVPMVGERVVAPGGVKPATVAGHRVVVRLQTSDGAIEWDVNAEKCSPVPNEDKALVERVARAMFEADHPDGGWDASGWDGRIDRETYRDRAKAALRAMEKKP